MDDLIINVNGSVSLANPCPSSPLHISEETEVVRVFPIYNSLTNEKKKEILGNVKKWIESEEAQLDIVENYGM